MRTSPAAHGGFFVPSFAAAAILLACAGPSTAADPEREKIARSVKALQAAKDHDAAIAAIRDRLAKSSDPYLRALLADALFKSGQKEEALATAEALCGELERKEREAKLPPEEAGVQKSALELREKMLPGSREFQDLKRSSVAGWLDLARKKAARGEGPAARLALGFAEKVDPKDPELEKVLETVEEIGVRGEWKDLANLKPASVKEPKEHPFRLNWPPTFLGESTDVLRKAGFYLPNQKFIYMHPPDDDEGSWAIFRFQSPVQLFKARIAVPHPEKKEGDVLFKLFTDGKEIASEQVRGGEPAHRVFKKFPPCRELKLFVGRNGHWHWDDCLWIEPRVK